MMGFDYDAFREMNRAFMRGMAKKLDESIMNPKPALDPEQARQDLLRLMDDVAKNRNRPEE